MVDLSDKEKRLLTLAMGIQSLAGVVIEQGSMLGEATLMQCESTLEASIAEFEDLFFQVDQPTLVKKLASPLDPEASDLSIKLRKELLNG
jgi:hypothetical protein